MNKDLLTGKAPQTVERVDKGKMKGEQDHVHFGDGSALNRDGAWKHPPDGGGTHVISNQERAWLQSHGWPNIP